MKYAIIHHCGGTDSDPYADTSNQTFEDVNAWHRINPNVWLGKLSSLGYALGYHYFIDKYGKVTQAREDTEQAAHCIGYNNNPWDPADHSAIGICLAGNFDISFPTDAQIFALKNLLDVKVKQYGLDIKNIVPHRTYANKSCYGRNLAEGWARNLLTPITASACSTENQTIAALKVEVSAWQQFVNYLRKIHGM